MPANLQWGVNMGVQQDVTQLVRAAVNKVAQDPAKTDVMDVNTLAVDHVRILAVAHASIHHHVKIILPIFNHNHLIVCG